MDLGRIQINPRLRTSWEAIDLGFTLARQWFKPLYLSWALPSLTVFLLSAVICHLAGLADWLPLVMTWWLKPLWDCAPLKIGSQALFGDRVTVAEAIRSAPGLLRPEWFSWLSWRRLSPFRSFSMPVTALERLAGTKRSRRLTLLHQRSGSSALWITIICVLMEFILGIGCYSLVALLIPDSFGIGFMELAGGDSATALFIDSLATWLAMSVIAPFYTMAGFALYINRRIELEAWDIEIRFRDLASRNETAHRARANSQLGRVAGVVIGLLFTALLATVTPQPAYALERQQARELATEVFNNEAFHQMETESGWRLKQPKENNETIFPEWLLDTLEWLLNNLSFSKSSTDGFSFANIVELLTWLAAGSVLIWLIIHYRRTIGALFSAAPKAADIDRTAPPKVLFGLDVSQENLPEDIPAEAETLWHQGRSRAAVGLLYRATLSRLIHQHGLAFHPGHTEQECAALVHKARANSTLDSYVQNLTEQWQLLAYAHRQPPAQAFEHLCHNWRELFTP